MSADKRGHCGTPKITSFTTITPAESNPLKRSNSQISPVDQKTFKKKVHLDKKDCSTIAMESDQRQIQYVNIESLIEPIMQEFKSLKNTMATKQGEMSKGFNHLKTVHRE